MDWLRETNAWGRVFGTWQARTKPQGNHHKNCSPIGWRGYSHSSTFYEEDVRKTSNTEFYNYTYQERHPQQIVTSGKGNNISKNGGLFNFCLLITINPFLINIESSKQWFFLWKVFLSCSVMAYISYLRFLCHKSYNTLIYLTYVTQPPLSLEFFFLVMNFARTLEILLKRYIAIGGQSSYSLLGILSDICFSISFYLVIFMCAWHFHPFLLF